MTGRLSMFARVLLSRQQACGPVQVSRLRHVGNRPDELLRRSTDLDLGFVLSGKSRHVVRHGEDDVEVLDVENVRLAIVIQAARFSD